MTDVSFKAETVAKILRAPYPFFALLAGMQLDVFTILKNGSMNANQIADAIGVKPAKLKPLLYALVAAELLTVEGDLFSNTNEADLFLIPSSPSYMGNDVYLNVDPLIMSFVLSGALKTSESILTGTPQCSYDFSTLSEDELEKGFRATLPIAVRAGRELVAKYDFSSYRRLLDVGGGVGGLAVAITEVCPHLDATVIELPMVIPITRRFLEEVGAADRVQVMTADVVRDSLKGSFDVAVLRAFIQILPPDEACHALKSVSKTINPGGVIYILGHILDNSRTLPHEEVWYSILNLNFYDVPGSYTELEYSNWLKEAGFDQIVRDTLPNGDGVMIARKYRGSGDGA